MNRYSWIIFFPVAQITIFVIKHMVLAVSTHTAYDKLAFILSMKDRALLVKLFYKNADCAARTM